MCRIRVLPLIATLMLAVIAGSPAAIAQVATPVPLDDHPVMGSWQMTSPEPHLLQFTSDGLVIYVEAVTEFNPVDPAGPPTSAVGIGAWEATGERTAEATFRLVGIAGGYAEFHVALELSEDSQSLSGTAVIQFKEPDGTVTREFTASISADRLTVQPAHPAEGEATPAA